MKHYTYTLTTALQLALDSIRAHILRSFLTLLGVIIGVAGVAIVGAAIEGLGAFAKESAERTFGTNSYLIAQIASAGNLDRKERARRLRRNKRIRTEDLDYLRDVTGDQVTYSPYRQQPDDVKRDGITYEGAAILGVAHTLPDIREVAVAGGCFFTANEERTRRRVAIIGEDIRDTLFPFSSAIGETIKLRGYDFHVIGIQDKLGSMGPVTQDNSVFIPSSAFTRIYGRAQTISIFGSARPESGLTPSEALDLTRVALRSRFRTPPGEEDNFDFFTPDASQGLVDNILGLVRMIVLPITLIALAVGGIVIMNIMLVSVTERTREIGIRKSLGARRNDIMLQFLIEALLLGGFGGIMGVLLAYTITTGISAILEFNLPVTAGYVALALITSSTVGLASGWYPAVRAARLDPAVALRKE